MRQKALVCLVSFVCLLVLAPLAGATVNKSIHIDEGETVERGLNSVNGSIKVGASADLQRSAETVNGSISIADDSRTRDLSSVNGTVRVGARVSVDGDLKSVNGSIHAGAGAEVSGGVETVNGSIKLRGATVQEDLRTINGSIVLDQGSRVQGDLIIDDTNSRNRNHRRKPLEIELRDGSVIEGAVDVRDKDRKVIIRMSGGSAVMGEVRGAEVVQE